MSKSTRSAVKYIDKKTGSGKKVESRASNAEIKRGEQNDHVGEETIVIKEHNHSVKEICSEETTTKRRSTKSREKKNNDNALFPARRRSCHDLQGEEVFLASTKKTVSVDDVCTSFEVTEEKKETLMETDSGLHKLVGSSKSSSFLPNTKIIYQVIVIVILASAIAYAVELKYGIYKGKPETENFSIESIKQKFPKQSNFLWKAVSSGLNDTLKFKQPTSFILLHGSDADYTVRKLLMELSQYAVCKLSNCNNKPIELNSNVLNSSGFVENDDYGIIIARFKKDLENIGVMVIENLDEIPEKYALAFHSFCDQVSPLVQKSAFFFSMKINTLEASPIYDVKRVEEVLKKKWKHMEDDIFLPLFTRLAEMLIWIHPE